MFRSGTARAGLKQAAAIQERNDGEHLGAGAKLEDREKVGQVVTQNVAGNGDGVKTLADPFERVTHCLHRSHDLDGQAFNIMIFDVLNNLTDQFGIMGAVAVEPEDSRGTCCAGAADRQFDPVLDRQVLDTVEAPDVTGLNFVAGKQGTVGSNDLYHTVGGDFEGGRVGAVLLGLLGHEANVGHRAHGSRIQSTVLLAVLKNFFVHGSVAAVRNHGVGVLQFAFGVPHLAGITNHDRHGGVDDDVVGNVQVCNTLIGIDHGQSRTLGVNSFDVCFNLGFLVSRQHFNFFVEITKTHVRVNTGLFEGSSMLLEYIGVENLDGVAKHDRVGNLHHGGFQMKRQELSLFLGNFNLLGVESAQGLLANKRRGYDLTRLALELVFQHLDAAVLAGKFNFELAAFTGSNRLLVGVKITTGHVGNFGDAVGTVGAKLVGIFLGEILDRDWRAAVRVALTQNRIDSAAEHLGVFFGNRLLFVILRDFRVVGDLVPFGLQLGNSLFQLWHRSTDVRELDDIRLRSQGELAQLGQEVRDLLLRGQVFGKICDNTTGNGDVSGLNFNSGAFGECLHDRKQGVGCQCGSFIDFSPDNLVCHVLSYRLVCQPCQRQKNKRKNRTAPRYKQGRNFKLKYCLGYNF